MQRASKYVVNADAAGEGNHNDSAFSLAGHVASFTTESGARLTDGEILDMLRPWNLRNSPPIDESELSRCVLSALTNCAPRTEKVVMSSDGLIRLIIGKREAAQDTDIVTFGDLHHQYPRMKAAVVEGLFRQGETATLISVSKAGKSWLFYDLALSIITGRPWLDRFNTRKAPPNRCLTKRPRRSSCPSLVAI